MTIETIKELFASDPSEALYRAEERLSRSEFMAFIEWTTAESEAPDDMTQQIPTDDRQLAAMLRMAEREAYRHEAERETYRQLENEILACDPTLDPSNTTEWANHYREVAAQIRDHRANGNYTTMHR
jgi:hypothetical protein